ncbi:MAG: glycosyltransferase family 9 protein [Planctomycetota bacterium]|nr:glycosyltransferase family 9 protein [Planctomycetota bacterium]
MRRLIVKLSSIGDVVHTLPAFRALRAAFPDDFIAWAVEEPAHPVLEGLPGLDRAILIPRRRWLSRWSTAREAFGLFSRIRAMSFDQVIDFQGLARSALVSAFSGATERIGFRDGREGSPLFYHRRISIGDVDRHAVDRNLALVRALGASTDGIHRGLAIPERARESVRRLIDREGLDSGFVILHPSAGRATNRYPPDRFADLGDRVAGELGVRVAVTGSATDRSLTRELIERMERDAVDLTGRLDLWELAELSRTSLAFVAGDTGPLHLAIEAGSSVIGIYGGADPTRTGPYGGRSRLVRSRVPCGPCYRRTCPGLPCLQSIDPDEVFEQVRQTVGSGANASCKGSERGARARW